MLPTLVVLVEEPSMEALLNDLLPRVIGDRAYFKIIPHQGVTDLERSLPRKLRAWRDPNARFLIVRDNDRGDCMARKRKLVDLCVAAGRQDQFLVRIVCQELEAWFLGDTAALQVFGAQSAGGIKLRKLQNKYQDPDSIHYPAKELEKIFGEYYKISGAKAIAPHINIDLNRSRSFQNFISAVDKLITEV